MKESILQKNKISMYNSQTLRKIFVQHSQVHVLCFGMHSNVMICFVTQVLQDPLLSSHTVG